MPDAKQLVQLRADIGRSRGERDRTAQFGYRYGYRMQSSQFRLCLEQCGQHGNTPEPEALQHFLEAAVTFGYWLGTPDDNAAIGLSLGFKHEEYTPFLNEGR